MQSFMVLRSKIEVFDLEIKLPVLKLRMQFKNPLDIIFRSLYTFLWSVELGAIRT
jgi:hypothetical protein